VLVEVTGIVTGVVVGLIIGLLGRLVAPGRQGIPSLADLGGGCSGGADWYLARLRRAGGRYAWHGLG
jgi:hypothetical protein